MTAQLLNSRRATSLVLLVIVPMSVFASVKYPVRLPGYGGDTTVDGFSMDTSGSLALSAKTSDPYIINTNVNNNIALYRPSSASYWTWAMQLGVGLTLEDIELK